MFGVVESLWLSTIGYRSYFPTFKATAFLFKILIQMCPLSLDRVIWIYAFVEIFVTDGLCWKNVV